MFAGGRNNTDERMERENQRLLEKIIENGEDPDRRIHDNVLLVGKTGCGKSALISSIFTSVVGKYRQVVRSGAGEAQTVTLSLKHVKNFGIRDHDVENNQNVKQLTKIIEAVPNVYDFAGLGNVNTPELKEILQAVIHGYVRPGTSFERLEAFQKRYGVGKLQKLFRYPRKEWKVSRVVFVQSCVDSVPDLLIDCLNSVLREVDPWRFTQTFKGSVFIVITKKDKAPRGSMTSNLMKHVRNQDDNDNTVERDLSRKFNFGGNLEYNRIWVTNYSDETGFSYIPEIANMHLQLLYHLTLRTPNDDEEDAIFTMSSLQYFWLELTLFLDGLCQPFQGQMSKSVAIAIVFVAVFMYFIVTHLVPKLSI